MKPVQQEELLDIIYRALSQQAGIPAVAEPERATWTTTADEPATEDQPSRRLNVLVAEDNRFNQQVILRMLERRGHAVQTAQDGKQTLAALERSAFDVLLLDVNMPQMDGFEVIKTIREREKTTGTHLPVIALTALSGERDRQRCVEAGVDEYLAKPVPTTEVFATLERVMPAHPAAEADGASGRATLIYSARSWTACGGDGALLAEMIQLFGEEAPGLLARVEAAVRSSDPKQLRMAAH